MNLFSIDWNTTDLPEVPEIMEFLPRRSLKDMLIDVISMTIWAMALAFG